MTQANLEAYALAEGYTTAYTAMDQAQQVAVRYQYVLANTQTPRGTSPAPQTARPTSSGSSVRV